jgi:apolipoprotein N-acyltransferase
MNGWQAFRRGLSLSLRCQQVVLLLFAVNLLSALLLAILPALALASSLGHLPAIREAADGVDAWFVLESMMSPLTSVALEQDPAEAGLGQAALLGLLIAGILPLLAWLPATFLNGGLLLTYVEAVRRKAQGQDPLPFRLRRFLWGCWHWWGAFLLLGVIQGFAFALIVLPSIIVGVLAVSAVGYWLAWVVLPLLGLLVVLGLVLVEWIRILAVVTGTRNLFRAFGQAVRFVFRHLLPVTGLYGLSLLLVAVLHAVYRLGLMPVLPLDWWPLVLLVQQTFILARLLTRVARLAGGVVLIAGSVAPEQTRRIVGE